MLIRYAWGSTIIIQLDTTIEYRANACDTITHRNQYKICFRMARPPHDTNNICHAQASDTALLCIISIPLHLVYSVGLPVNS